jgi:hypothetical protein
LLAEGQSVEQLDVTNPSESKLAPFEPGHGRIQLG